MSELEQLSPAEEEAANTILQSITTDPSKTVDIARGLNPSLNWIAVYKNFDRPDFNIETRDHFVCLWKIWTMNNVEKTFPFNLIFTEWNNKKAQSNIITYILDLKIDLDSNLYLTNIIRKEFVNENAYLNSTEFFKAVAGLNNRNHILRIKSDSPELCLLGLANVIPKFNDIFDDLFIRAIETNCYVLEYLFLNKRVAHKLELLEHNTAFLLVLRHKLFDTILANHTDFSFDILVTAHMRSIVDVNVLVTCRAKNEGFLSSLVLYLLKKEIEVIIIFIPVLDSLSTLFKADTHANYLKIKLRVDSMLYDEKDIIDNLRDVKKIANLKNGIYEQRNFLNRICNHVIDNYEHKQRLIVEEMLNEGLFDYNMGLMAQRLLELDTEDYNLNMDGSIINTYEDYDSIDDLTDIDGIMRLSTEKNIEKKNEKKNEEKKNRFYIPETEDYNITGGCINKNIDTDIDVNRNIKTHSSLSNDTKTVNCIGYEVGVEYNDLFTSCDSKFDFYMMYKFIITQKVNNVESVVLFLERYPHFKMYCIDKIFMLVQSHFNCDNCIGGDFFYSLGVIVALVTLCKYRMYTLDTFDTRKFIMECRKSKKYYLINFVIGIIETGQNYIFRIANPWVVRIIQDIINVKFTDRVKDLDVSRIKKIYNHDFQPCKIKESEHLATYVLSNSKFDEIISLAIDVSIREVSRAMVIRTMEIVEKSINEIRILYDYKGLECLYINLGMALLDINIHEPLKVCIKTNLANFFRICNLDINKISVNSVVECNIELAKEVIKMEMYTRIKSVNLKDGSIKTPVDALNKNRVYDRIDIKDVKEKEFEEIRRKLKVITKEIPNTKYCIVLKEWDKMVELVNYQHNNSYSDYYSGRVEIKRVCTSLLRYIETSDCSDDLCESLSKHITGYLFRDAVPILFYFLDELFKISFTCYLETKSYLIYSHENKVSDDLAIEYIKHGIYNVSEYDQFTAHEQKKSAEECVKVIKSVVLGETKYATIYDFLYTLESIFKHQSINFIEKQIIDFNYMCGNDLDTPLFDEVVGVLCYSNCPDSVVYSKIKIDSVFIISAISISWDHFLRYRQIPSKYRYMKLDCLISILNDPFVFMETFADLIIVGIESGNILFLKFLNRILYLLKLKDDLYLKDLMPLLKPSTMPFFTCFYISNAVNNTEKSLELLKALNANYKLYDRICEYFKNEPSDFNHVYNYAVSPKYPFLKNHFMCPINNTIIKKYKLELSKLPIYFRIRILLQINRTAFEFKLYKGYVTAVVDSLGNEYFDEIKTIIRNGHRKEELRNCLEMRIAAGNAPVAIFKALDMLK